MNAVTRIARALVLGPLDPKPDDRDLELSLDLLPAIGVQGSDVGRIGIFAEVTALD